MKRLLSENDKVSRKVDEKKENLCGLWGEINLLLNNVPQLNDHFDIRKKVGEGTFSSVYLAIIRGSGPKNKLVALKHLIPTLQPNKILFELQCLHKLGGQFNIMGLYSCVRQGNHTVIVMPYFPNTKFVDFFHELSITEIAGYMKSLLEALAFIHSCGVIHRDIKPSNFLYHRKLKRAFLVDFGLAQRSSSCFTARKKSRSVIRFEHTVLSPANRNNDDIPLDKAFVKLSPSTLGGMSRLNNSHVQLTINGNDNMSTNDPSAKCQCYNNPQVCRSCTSKPAQVVSRAGTPGYRPPEVLFKHPNQTTAIDVWAAGVILLSLLSGRYPFFHSNDDISSLAEITTLFGTEALKNCALKLGKVITCSPQVPALTLKHVCDTLRPAASLLNNVGEESTNEMYDLLYRLLDLDFETRITASDALKHKFIQKYQNKN